MIRLDPTIAARLEAAERLIVSSRQRAAAVRLAYTLARRDRQAPWVTPQVISRRAWLLAQASERLREGDSSCSRVLEPQEEWLAWRSAAQAWLSEEELDLRGALSAEALADALRQSCTLGVEWGLPPERLRGEPSMESRCLVASATFVARVARERDALAAHEGWRLLQEKGLVEPTAAEFSIGSLPAAWQRLTAGRWRSVEPYQDRADGRGIERVCSAGDPTEEVLRAAAWCRQHLERDPWARLLIVVPDLASRRATIERVFRETLSPTTYRDAARGTSAFAIEGGIPLIDYAEPRGALESLYRLTRRSDEVALAELLDAHFWGGDTLSVRATLAERLRASGTRRIWPREFSLRLRQLVGPDVRAGEAERRIAEECARRIDAALEILGRPGGGRCQLALRALGFPWPVALDSDREQVRRHWDEWLAQVEPRAFEGGGVELAAAVDTLRHLARRERFAPSTGDVPVTITGALEAPVVRYDGIRVLGMQADRWPEPVSLDPFLPPAMQRLIGLTGATPEQRWRSARALMDSWRHGADELVWSWARRDEETIWQPSPLIAALVDDPPSVSVPVTDLATRLRSSSSVVLESYADDQGAPCRAEKPIPGGSRALIDQAECPFRAYARHRLGARMRESVEPGVSTLERGRFLHRVLWHFWSQLDDTSERLTADDGVLDAAIARAADELQRDPRDPLEARWIEREIQRARRILTRWREVEAARPPFRVIMRESPIELLLGATRVALQVDRADRLEDGSLVVIDYKTGAYRRLKFDGPLLDAIQLWLYAEAIEQASGLEASRVRAVGQLHLEGSGTRWAALRALDCTLPGISTAADWESIRRDARVFLEGLAEDFSAGVATVSPRAQACRRCDLSLVCRRSVVLSGTRDDEQDKA